MAEQWPELPRRKSKAEVLADTMNTVTTLADDRIAELEAELAHEKTISKRWCERAMYASERCGMRDLWAKAWKRAAKKNRELMEEYEYVVDNYEDFHPKFKKQSAELKRLRAVEVAARLITGRFEVVVELTGADRECVVVRKESFDALRAALARSDDEQGD